MVTKEKRKGLNQMLASMAEDMVSSASCTWFWGEEELPECLRGKREEQETNEKENI